MSALIDSGNCEPQLQAAVDHFLPLAAEVVGPWSELKGIARGVGAWPSAITGVDALMDKAADDVAYAWRGDVQVTVRASGGALTDQDIFDQRASAAAAIVAPVKTRLLEASGKLRAEVDIAMGGIDKIAFGLPPGDRAVTASVVNGLRAELRAAVGDRPPAELYAVVPGVVSQFVRLDPDYAPHTIHTFFEILAESRGLEWADFQDTVSAALAESLGGLRGAAVQLRRLMTVRASYYGAPVATVAMNIANELAFVAENYLDRAASRSGSVGRLPYAERVGQGMHGR